MKLVYIIYFLILLFSNICAKNTPQVNKESGSKSFASNYDYKNNSAKNTMDPTKVVSKLALMLSNTGTGDTDFGVAGVLSIDSTKKLIFKYQFVNQQFTVGVGWLFKYGIINAYDQQIKFDDQTTTNRFYIGGYIPLSAGLYAMHYKNLSRKDLMNKLKSLPQFFPSLGYNYVHTNRDLTQNEVKKYNFFKGTSFDAGYTVPTVANSAYFGGLGFVPIVPDRLTFVAFGNYSIGKGNLEEPVGTHHKDVYKGFSTGAGLSLSFFKFNHIIAMISYNGGDIFGNTNNVLQYQLVYSGEFNFTAKSIYEDIKKR